jgi:hypothetical protein
MPRQQPATVNAKKLKPLSPTCALMLGLQPPVLKTLIPLESSKTARPPRAKTFSYKEKNRVQMLRQQPANSKRYKTKTTAAVVSFCTRSPVSRSQDPTGVIKSKQGHHKAKVFSHREKHIFQMPPAASKSKRYTTVATVNHTQPLSPVQFNIAAIG